MDRSMSEKKVLKKLGIPDFRHMTKDKVVKFVSLLPNMDPEVAKKALEQFPAFADLAKEMVVQLKLLSDKTFEEDRLSQQSFYETCNKIIDSLTRELEDPNIDSGERERIEDKMVMVAQMIGNKDSEHKAFLLKMSGIFAGFIGFISVGALALLGVNSSAHSRNGHDQEDEDDLQS